MVKQHSSMYMPKAAGCCCWTRPRQGRRERPRPDQAKARHNKQASQAKGLVFGSENGSNNGSKNVENDKCKKQLHMPPFAKPRGQKQDTPVPDPSGHLPGPRGNFFVGPGALVALGPQVAFRAAALWGAPPVQFTLTCKNPRRILRIQGGPGTPRYRRHLKRAS